MPSLPLLNHHALITGATRGIGLAIARRFAADGASVTLIGRNEALLAAGLTQVQEQSRRALNPGSETALTAPQPDGRAGEAWGHTTFRADTRDLPAWERLFSELDAQGPAARENPASDATPASLVLVNAAGITQNSLLMRTGADAVREILETNLLGTTWGCRAFVDFLVRRRRKGCIVNVSSLLAVKGGRGASVYAASKAGILGLTRALAGETGRYGIRVNALVPGYIQTDMTKGE